MFLIFQMELDSREYLAWKQYGHLPLFVLFLAVLTLFCNSMYTPDKAQANS
jgi:hypothetical protein